MREIIFRGKDKDNNFVYGDLLSNTPDKRCFIQQIDYFLNPTKVNPETVGQYTGVEDLEQNEIFEGDIFIPLYFPPCTTVEKAIQLHEFDEDNIGVVTFEYGNTVLKKKYYRDKQLSDYIEQEFSHYQSNVGEIYKYKNNIALGKVIGNIYDNPRLIVGGGK